MTGNIVEASGDFLILKIDGGAGALHELKDKRLQITIKEDRPKRSQDANAYYWTLTSKMAAALRISNTCMHNMLLRRYGTLEEIDGRAVFVEIPPDNDMEVLEAESYHLKPIDSGRHFDTYAMIKGSSRYTAKEMQRLIEGTQDEAKALGIETKTPAELEELLRIYERNKRA